jgi:hypothetical protein
MDYTELSDKFERQADHLTRLLERMPDDPSAPRLDLVLQQAKRVRRTSNLVVQALARHRDQLQPKEGTST